MTATNGVLPASTPAILRETIQAKAQKIVGTLRSVALTVADNKMQEPPIIETKRQDRATKPDKNRCILHINHPSEEPKLCEVSATRNDYIVSVARSSNIAAHSCIDHNILVWYPNQYYN